MKKNKRPIIAIVISLLMLISVLNINIVTAAGETVLASGTTLTGTISTAGSVN